MLRSLLTRVPAARSAGRHSAPVRSLNIHEYQSQALMAKFGVPAPRGVAVHSAEDAAKACTDLGGGKVVVKSQVLAGGRGKGTFDTGFQGGVHVVNNASEAQDIASKMLGNRLITKQSGAEGLPVNTLLVAECLEVKKEYYFAIMADRAVGGPVMIASSEGGMNIEEVAESNPDAIIKMPMHPDGRREPEKCAEVARRLGFTDEQVPKVADTLDRLYHLFEACDATMVEINPLAEMTDGTVMPFDAKLNFDDNAAPRQKEIFEMRDTTQEDPRDVEAERIGVAYVGLDGNVGCIANGAGEAMATLDALALYGGSAANFLDCGGSATREQVTEIFKLLLKDERVKVIFVNIFAGIAKADVIAEGVIAATRELGLTVPVVARLCGTGADRAAELISESGLDIIAENDLDKAASKAASLAK